MTDNSGIVLPPEDKERVMSMTNEIFVPQLQASVEAAQEGCSVA